MKNRNLLFASIIALFAIIKTNAQEGFGTNSPAPSSVIDMTATNKGALLPRVALTSTTVAAPVTAPANALTVFNTATAGDVTPGYYYWSTAGSVWIRLITSNIYTADGSLTSNRTLDVNGKVLHFKGTDEETYWSEDGSINQSGSNGKASLSMYGGNNSNLFIQQFQNSNAQIFSSDNSTSLNIGTHATAVSAPLLFVTSAGSNALGTEKMRVTGEGNVGINTTMPTEKLDNFGIARIRTLPLNGATNAIYTTSGGTASSTQNQTFTATKTIVADANGVLGSITGVPLTTEGDGVIGNEVTNATTNGGLTRVGIGTTVSPYTLGLTSGTTTGDLMTWNGTAWTPAAAANIYNTNGSLTSARTLTNNGFNLTLLGTNQSTLFSATSGITQRGIASGKRASVVLQSDDNDSDGVTSRMSIFQDPENVGQIKVTGDSRGLSLGSSNTTQAAPITFATSTGSNDSGSQKMILTASGNLGITGTVDVTEKLDVNGITRVRTLPLNGATNAINTTTSGTLSSAQDQTFTATRTLVADANGVLGYVSGLPSTALAGPWFNTSTSTAATANTQNIYQMGKVGVMTNNPTALVHSYNNSSLTNPFTVESDNAGTGLGNDTYLYGYGSSLTPGFFFLSARGSKASPTALQTGDLMGEYNFGGYTSGGWNYSLCSVRGSYDGNGTTLESSLQFLTSSTVRMKISSVGNLGINTTAPAAKLHVVKSASDLTPAIIEGCTTYTDNTAATAAGLPVGALYRKADGTLMVRY